MFNETFTVLFPPHIESELVLDIFKCGLQALKTAIFLHIERKLAQWELFSPSFVLSTFKIKVFSVTCSRMLVKVCVQRCSFIITSSPAPLQQKVSQAFWASEIACALVFPDPSIGNLTALARERPKPKPTPPPPLISARWAFVETSL